MKPTTFLLVLTFLGISCSDLGEPNRNANPTGPFGTQQYLPGRLVVGFVDSVDYRFIVSFISALNLDPISVEADSSFSMWIQVDSGGVDVQLAKILQDSAVAWADQRGYAQGDPQKSYLLAHFRGTVKPDYGIALIQSIPGISWKITVVQPRNALIKVPIGQEFQWIDSLKTYQYVTWAELDFIVRVSTR